MSENRVKIEAQAKYRKPYSASVFGHDQTGILPAAARTAATRAPPRLRIAAADKDATDNRAAAAAPRTMSTPTASARAASAASPPPPPHPRCCVRPARAVAAFATRGGAGARQPVGPRRRLPLSPPWPRRCHCRCCRGCRCGRWLASGWFFDGTNRARPDPPPPQPLATPYTGRPGSLANSWWAALARAGESGGGPPPAGGCWRQGDPCRQTPRRLGGPLAAAGRRHCTPPAAGVLVWGRRVVYRGVARAGGGGGWWAGEASGAHRPYW